VCARTSPDDLAEGVRVFCAFDGRNLGRCSTSATKKHESSLRQVRETVRLARRRPSAQPCRFTITGASDLTSACSTGRTLPIGPGYIVPAYVLNSDRDALFGIERVSRDHDPLCTTTVVAEAVPRISMPD